MTIKVFLFIIIIVYKNHNKQSFINIHQKNCVFALIAKFKSFTQLKFVYISVLLTLMILKYVPSLLSSQIKLSKFLLSTVNKKQMEQFNKITSWWHPSSEMNVLFQYNYKRIQFLRDILNKNATHNNNQKINYLQPLEGFSAIDVGCGAGFLSQSLTRLGARIIGLDPNSTSYKQAVAHKNLNQSLINLQYFNVSIQEYLQSHPEQKQSHDLISSMDVIEHVDNPQEFIISLVQSLKPNGLIFLSTINKTISSFLTHILVAEYVTGIVPKGTHNYQKFINPKDLCDLLDRNGIDIQGVRQLEYTWRGQFAQCQGGANYMVIGRKRKPQTTDQMKK